MHALIEVPRHLSEALALEPQIEQLARDLAKSRDVLYLGRGTNLSDRARRRPQAQGNLLHPRRGLCRRRTQARSDRADRRDHAGDRDRALRSGVREDRLEHAGSRRAWRPVDPGHRREGRGAADGQPSSTLTLPTVPSAVGPLVYAVPVQLIAYHTAVAMGTDVDQPRNLAKSVTVE